MEISLAAALLLIMIVHKSMKIVPQQAAVVVERLGKFNTILQPGINIIIPFVDAVRYSHSLKETSLNIPKKIFVTKDKFDIEIDSILYFQVTDPYKASYGSPDFVAAITQLLPATLESVIGKLERDRAFDERDFISSAVITEMDEAASNWGVKLLRLKIKDLTIPTSFSPLKF